MKRIVTFVLTLSISSALLGQVTKKALELPEFKAIYNNSNYTVYLKQTNKQEVSVEALTEIYELTTIFVENGILMINVERKPENTNKSIWAKIDDIKVNPTMKLYVSVKNVGELQVNGAGKIISENSLAAPSLNLSIGGSGSMDLDIKGDVVKAEVSGAGKMGIKGYASSLEGVVSGSGAINAFNCPLEKATIKVSGTGLAELNVTDTITATVVGSGSVKHKGNTKNATKKVYGSGSVDRAY
ncbi:MAG TPA: head GIN domain-containing protein [Cyclobacteriaceae bacterium]|nr:head GIN domain-containing protein [Cyclobacteriaceae bacterium]HRJ83391.1 head GIN domain-containing protein [Cyclobacteriaceae bacterium]